MKTKLLLILFFVFTFSAFSQTLSIGDYTVQEGADTNALIQLSLSSPSGTDIIIELDPTPGTADASDFVDNTLTVTIPAGETLASVNFPIINDNVDEATEYFTIVSTIITGNVTNSSPANVTILEDPTDVPTIILDDLTVLEATDSQALISVSLSNPSDTDVEIVVTVNEGSAGTNDYVETVVIGTIPAGDTSKIVTITITDDNCIEGTETFSVVGTSNNGQTSNSSHTAIVTILDDPADTEDCFLLPFLYLRSVTVQEGVDTIATIALTLSEPVTDDVVLKITQTPLTANIDDYTDTIINITIPAGETNTSVEIEIKDDSLIEPNERFLVNAEIISGSIEDTNPGSSVVIEDDETPNSIAGKLTYNLNSDNCVTGIPVRSSIVFENTTTNNLTYTYSSSSTGEYSKNIYGEGTIKTAIDSNIYNSSPVDYTNTITATAQTITNQDFCLEFINPGDNVKIIVFSTSDARPGFESKYKIRYENIGSTTVSGDITLDFEDDKMSYLSSNQTTSSTTSNSLTWSYSNLAPFEIRYINVSFTINTPTDPTNPVVDGDLLNFEVNITPLTSDIDQSNNSRSIVKTVVNSYDPNDFTIIEGEEITADQATKDLNFRIRFQNKGSASAINIEVITLLDAFLDWDTFTPIDASHDYNISFDKTSGQLVFDFPNINLPDSTTDEPGSNGWILFKAKPKSTFEIGDIISATADIFFDFNAPITTNTATTQIENSLGVKDAFISKITLYPNPVSNILNVNVSDSLELTKIKVKDILGKSVLQTSERNIDMSNLSNGMYLIQIHTNKGVISKKVIKN